jgi:periplasmic divalent cation tolerance protein
MSDPRVVFITVPNEETAKTLSHGLVNEGLAACVNIIPGIQSVYRWEGQVQSDNELLLICKTDLAAWDALRTWVTSHHPYTVPEIIQFPISEGSLPYLEWIVSSLR